MLAADRAEVGKLSPDTQLQTCSCKKKLQVTAK